MAVELNPRKAGIKVLTRDEQHSYPSNPYLYINVSTHKYRSVLYAVDISIWLMQQVILLGNPSITTSATTWFTGGTGVIGCNKLRDIEEFLKGFVDQFINDYLTANPK